MSGWPSPVIAMPFIAQVAPSPPIIPIPRIMPPPLIIPMPPIMPPCNAISWRSAAARSGSGKGLAGNFSGGSDEGSRAGFPGS